VLLASMVPLYLGGLLSDLAYRSSYQLQWSNFAAWLIAGALVFTGLTLLWSVVTLVRAVRRRGWPLVYFLVVLAIFVLGLLNSFIHARDAWGMMPTGLILSFAVTALAVVATWIGFSGRSHAGDVR